MRLPKAMVWISGRRAADAHRHVWLHRPRAALSIIIALFTAALLYLACAGW
jgi:hypothetical protein